MSGIAHSVDFRFPDRKFLPSVAWVDSIKDVPTVCSASCLGWVLIFRSCHSSAAGLPLTRDVFCGKLVGLMRTRHLRMLYIPTARECTKIKDLISVLFRCEWNLV